MSEWVECPTCQGGGGYLAAGEWVECVGCQGEEGWTDFAPGGVIRGPSDPSDDSIPFMLSPCRQITDPDEAEALGLTVEARRMRER